MPPFQCIRGKHIAAAPGFFAWNSEVGKRTVGVSTFWFQAVCANHIVWDAIDVTEVTRRHTGRVREALTDIRAVIEALVAKRDARKDGFARLIKRAMETRYGQDAEEVQTLLAKAGFTRTLAKKAADLAYQKGAFTVWTVVDALTQLAREAKYAGSRVDADTKAAALLGLVSAPRRVASASPATPEPAAPLPRPAADMAGIEHLQGAA